MAGAMLETVVGEFSKLKEKVEKIKAMNTSKSMFFIRRNAARAAQVEGCGEGDVKQAKEAIFVKGNSKARSFMVVEEEEETLSESTVCLLMDRFVPW